MNDIHRRNALKLAGATFSTIAFPAIIKAQTKSSAPIKIGVNLPLSGVFSLVGQEATKGVKMYLDSIGGTVAGRKIEVRFEDETVQVNTAVAKARKLIESDGVSALLGGVATPVIYATVPLVVKAKVPYIVTVGGGSEVSRKSKRNDYTFRTSYNIWSETYPFARWAAQNGIKTAFIFCPDFAAGKEFAEAFKAGFTQAGGKITGEAYAPLATTDFVPYLTKIAESNPEAVFSFWAAGAAIRYLTTANEVGFNKKTHLLLNGFACDYDTLPVTGDAVVGSTSVHIWDYGLPNKANQTFIKDYEALSDGKRPSYLPLFGWDALHSVVTAIEKVGGDVEDREKFAAAFKGLSFDSPRGRMTIDADTHDIVQDLYVRKASLGSDGKIDFKVIGTLPKARDPLAEHG